MKLLIFGSTVNGITGTDAEKRALAFLTRNVMNDLDPFRRGGVSHVEVSHFDARKSDFDIALTIVGLLPECMVSTYGAYCRSVENHWPKKVLDPIARNWAVITQEHHADAVGALEHIVRQIVPGVTVNRLQATQRV